jgi:urease accessory protein
MKCFPKVLICLLSASYLPSAWAHPDISYVHGFVSGFIHPWLGVDHWLVVFAVGLYAKYVDSKSLRWLPLCYLMFITLGIGFAAVDIVVPAVEDGIVLSLFVMAFALIIRRQYSKKVMLPIIAFAAMCQGYVHAEEVSASNLALLQLVGLVLATLLLLAMGLLASRLSAKPLASLRLITSLSCFAIGTYALVGL